MIQFSPKSCSENICSASLQPVIEINDSNGPRLEGKKRGGNTWKLLNWPVFPPRVGDRGKSAWPAVSLMFSDVLSLPFSPWSLFAFPIDAEGQQDAVLPLHDLIRVTWPEGKPHWSQMKQNLVRFSAIFKLYENRVDLLHPLMPDQDIYTEKATSEVTLLRDAR